MQIATAGTYDFELASDDGSRLRIDDREVVLNDGLHGFAAKTGSVTLTAGSHAMRVEFFERDGGENLRLRYRRSGGSFAEIPASMLVHPKAPTSDQCPNDPNKTVPGLCGCGVPEGSCNPGSSTCTVATEGNPATLSCASGKTIGSITFASYGTPTGSCSTGGFTTGTCHASTSLEKVKAACLNKSSCSVLGSNSVFGDPCGGVGKKLAVTWTCSTPTTDACPNDPAKTAPGLCGCGVPEGSCGPSVKTAKATFSAGEPVVVTYANLPGGATDWIGIYVVGSANTAFLQYLYTGGKTSGSMTFSARAAGNYEARLFFNDSYNLASKVAFMVVGASAQTQ